MRAAALSLALLGAGAQALPHLAPRQESSSSSSSSAAPSSSESVSQVPIETATASAALEPTATPPSTGLPPAQSWCTDPIFCPGPIFQAIQLSELYPDSKTFVDKPTRLSENETLAAWEKLGENPTVGDIQAFVEDYFLGEGGELVAVELQDFNPEPAFLSNVTDDVVQGWLKIVHSYWTELIRETKSSAICGEGRECTSTFIPLNNTFPVPGGRFREVYYWDTYWIIHGLIQSELYELVKDVLNNFIDEINTIGFIPNGARIYYLDRSQPPLFTQMVDLYVSATNDTSILDRALPAIETELDWWQTNRTSSITSPFTQKQYQVARWNVTNSAPRPESYAEDWKAANGEDLEESYSEEQKAALYAELASGAESGWDFGGRWVKEPLLNDTDNNVVLRTLNIRALVPVDLNAILYRDHALAADLYELQASAAGKNKDKRNNGLFGSLLSSLSGKEEQKGDKDESKEKADKHRKRAEELKEAVLDLNWNATRLAFYDFNSTSHAHSDVWTPASYYPYWSGIVPEEVLNDAETAQDAFAAIRYSLDHFNGSIPTSLLETGLQWDFPNAWPPLQHIIVEALRSLPDDVSNAPLKPIPQGANSTFALVPEGQLGLTEDQIPAQPAILGDGPVWRDSFKGDDSGNWRDALVQEVAQRYISAAFCSWYSTGGSIPDLLEQLPAAQLNVSNANPTFTGNMFEKFNTTNLNQAGSGGEYEVVTGFGWTNGVALLFGAEFGDVLERPDCPAIIVEEQPARRDLGGIQVRYHGYRTPHNTWA